MGIDGARPETWLERHWKIARELTALVALILAFGALGYHYLQDVRPALRTIEGFARHEAAFAAIPEIQREMHDHRLYELEVYRVMVLQCRAVRQTAKLNPDECDRR